MPMKPWLCWAMRRSIPTVRPRVRRCASWWWSALRMPTVSPVCHRSGTPVWPFMRCWKLTLLRNPVDQTELPANRKKPLPGSRSGRFAVILETGRCSARSWRAVAGLFSMRIPTIPIWMIRRQWPGPWRVPGVLKIGKVSKKRQTG